MALAYDKAYSNHTYNSTEFTTYAPAPILKEECILWDPTCKTNLTKEQAADKFWGINGTMFKLLSDPCFGNDYGELWIARVFARFFESLLLVAMNQFEL